MENVRNIEMNSHTNYSKVMDNVRNIERTVILTIATAHLPLAHKVAQGFNQPRPPLRTFTKTIDLTKTFDMVNHTKLIQTHHTS